MLRRRNALLVGEERVGSDSWRGRAEFPENFAMPFLQRFKHVFMSGDFFSRCGIEAPVCRDARDDQLLNSFGKGSFQGRAHAFGRRDNFAANAFRCDNVAACGEQPQAERSFHTVDSQRVLTGKAQNASDGEQKAERNVGDEHPSGSFIENVGEVHAHAALFERFVQIPAEPFSQFSQFRFHCFRGKIPDFAFQCLFHAGTYAFPMRRAGNNELLI